MSEKMQKAGILASRAMRKRSARSASHSGPEALGCLSAWVLDCPVRGGALSTGAFFGGAAPPAYSRTTESICCPKLVSLRAVIPFTAPNSSLSVGRRRAISLTMSLVRISRGLTPVCRASWPRSLRRSAMMSSSAAGWRGLRSRGAACAAPRRQTAACSCEHSSIRSPGRRTKPWARSIRTMSWITISRSSFSQSR